MRKFENQPPAFFFVSTSKLHSHTKNTIPHQFLPPTDLQLIHRHHKASIMAGIARALSEGISNLTLGGDCYVPKNILLTGGAGFIGSHVAIKLVNANPDYKVRTLRQGCTHGFEYVFNSTPPDALRWWFWTNWTTALR